MKIFRVTQEKFRKFGWWIEEMSVIYKTSYRPLNNKWILIRHYSIILKTHREEGQFFKQY
jgi:hypothetical protein